MPSYAANLLGVVPAAGLGTRLPNRAKSKEILTVGTAHGRGQPSMSHLLRSFERAGVDDVAIVLRTGKQDIERYLESDVAPALTYHPTHTSGTRGVAETVALGLNLFAGASSQTVVFGFPDILFRPADAFVPLLATLERGDADVVLGLFPTRTPSKMDMVSVDNRLRVRDIQIKPRSTDLSLTWILAVWRPSFSAFLLDAIEGSRWSTEHQTDEAHLGYVFLSAMANGMQIEAVSFPAGESLDIGTPEDFYRAQEWSDIDFV